MKEIKNKLKELALLCIEKDVSFNFSSDNEANCVNWCAYTFEPISKTIVYLSGTCEVAAEWKPESIANIEKAIEKVKGL